MPRGWEGDPNYVCRRVSETIEWEMRDGHPACPRRGVCLVHFTCLPYIYHVNRTQAELEHIHGVRIFSTISKCQDHTSGIFDVRLVSWRRLLLTRNNI